MSTITMNGLVKVSIPQAVSTVATCNLADLVLDYRSGFNTASGKYCCNETIIFAIVAVVSGLFQYRKR